MEMKLKSNSVVVIDGLKLTAEIYHNDAGTGIIWDLTDKAL